MLSGLPSGGPGDGREGLPGLKRRRGRHPDEIAVADDDHPFHGFGRREVDR
jgi:hypothetical protein